MADLKITLNIDPNSKGFTWKDLNRLESGSLSAVHKVLLEFGEIEGVSPEELEEWLDSRTMAEMGEVVQAFMEVAKGMANPVVNGKNSNGGSPNTSSRGQVRRRKNT